MSEDENRVLDKETEIILLGYKRDRSMTSIHFFGLYWVHFGLMAKLKFFNIILYRRIKDKRQVFGIPAIRYEVGDG